MQSSWEQWSRTVLSAAGVMAAMVAIVLLIGIAKGVQKDLTEQVRSLGVNVLVIIPSRMDPGSMMFNPNMAGQSYLKPEHAQKLLTVKGVERTAMMTFIGGGLEANGKQAFSFMAAATPDWFRIRPTELEEGSLYTEANEGEAVCVIGSVAKKVLFGEKGSAIGKKVQINDEQYSIIGVTKDQESDESLFSMGSLQNMVYVPFQQFHNAHPEAQTSRIFVQADPNTEPKSLVKSLDASLAPMLAHEQYSVLTQEDLLGLMYKLMSILTWLLTGLTSIALFVGGIGIMAIMLMSVNFRIYEIGIRKTVGARQKDILVQFLFEAIISSVAGGAAGLAISGVVTWALNRYTAVHPEISIQLVGFSLAVCVGVGAVFGIIPAARAAKKDPVQALRAQG